MPGIFCSIHAPDDRAVMRQWKAGLKLRADHPEHVLEEFEEPGIHLACVYHPAVCKGRRLLVTEHFVLAFYGNVYQDEWSGTSTDQTLCEMLLDMFQTHGIDALQHLNGRYDIAVWDRRKHVLRMASDRFAANRHYYLHQSGRLHITGEVKALAAVSGSIDIDPAALASMLTFGYHIGDLTLVDGVKCLPNACRLQYWADQDRLTIDRYWDYPYGDTVPLSIADDEMAATLHELLLQALKRRLKGVDKILLPISGGLDSRTLAGLLDQSGFAGEVLAYSYGQPSSQDVRFGRAIARKLGYKHVAIPTPHDFVTRHLEADAWTSDAEWSAELHWAVRSAYRDPSLGDTSGYQVLSGMFGDIMLGSDRFNARRKLGDAPVPATQLSDAYFQLYQEYGTLESVLELFAPEFAVVAQQTLNDIVHTTFSSIAHLPPALAILRLEFEHRQRRHTSMVAQCIERDISALTPFLDTQLSDFALRIPYESFHDKQLYKRMIRRHLPNVATIPCAGTGQPLSDAPIKAALRWRTEKILRHLPRVRRRLQERNAFFRFHEGVIRQRHYFEAQVPALRYLEPILKPGEAEQRLQALLGGRSVPADQACALLPPAIFIRELHRRLPRASDIVDNGAKSL